MKKLTYLVLTAMVLVAMKCAEPVSADSPVVSPSATVRNNLDEVDTDYRVKVLEDFFKSKNSPLAGEAYYFVSYADKYDLDWRLVAAITGVESSFGKRIPVGSYNAYGWANGNYYFQSWEDSIETVSKTLRDKYYDRGLTNIYQIARVYAPPSTTWAWKVNYFMREIEPLPLTFTL